jgi:hypothetical protein
METKKQSKAMARAMIRQIIALSTAAFGLVAALAWNTLIQATIDTYIKPYMPKGSVIFSQLIYAIVVTALALFVTYLLMKINEKLGK